MNPSGTSIDEEAVSRLQQTSCRCHVFRDDFSISARTDAVPSYGLGTYVRHLNLVSNFFPSFVSRPEAHDLKFQWVSRP